MVKSDNSTYDDSLDFDYVDSVDKTRLTEYSFLNDLGLDQDVVSRLSSHLSRTDKGNTDVYVTPLLKDKKPSDILKAWDNIFQANKHKMNSTLIELEEGNRSKFGPRSIALPWRDRIDSLSEYFSQDSCSIPPGYLYKLGSHGNRNLRPLSVDKAIGYLKNNTNSGLPYYTSKGKVKYRLIEKFKDLLKMKYPCVLFTRTQESKKTRNVWGYPIADTLLETMYYRPLLDKQSRLIWRSALVGPEEVDRQVTNLINKAKVNGFKLVSIDLSHFDASGKSTVQRAAFNYIKDHFQSEYHKDLNYIAERFNSIDIVTPSGVISGKHGVPSGSTFTNEVDSIIQYLVAKSSGVVDEDLMQIQGDDGAFALNARCVEDFFKAYELAGLTINRDKSYVSDDFLIYLQCLYHNDYRDRNGLIGGIYPTYRALNRLLYQERWSDFEDFGLQGKDYYSLRAISILENVKYHPLFEEFVRFVVELDKYSLRVSHKGINDYVKYINDSSGSEGLLRNQYGDDPKGIKSFKSFKLISKM